MSEEAIAVGLLEVQHLARYRAPLRNRLQLSAGVLPTPAIIAKSCEREEAESRMSPVLRYALIALGGVVCGLIARVLSASVRGKFTKQVLLHRLIDGIAIVPAIPLIFWLIPLGDPSHGIESFALIGLFIVTYGGTRILTHTWIPLRSAGRERVIAFTHWLELMRVDPRAGHQFLKAYLAARGSDALLELRLAYANLERQRSAEPHVLLALDHLRAEIAQREETRTPSGAS